MLVGELLDVLGADLRIRKVRSLAGIQSHLKQVKSAFGDRRARAITTEAVDNYIESRLAEGMAPATVNRETGLLAQALRLAVDRHRLSAAPKIRRLSESDNVRTGFFEHADFMAMVEKLPDYVRDFCHFGYLTGWRRGEIASLVWADLDIDARMILLRGPEAKNGRARKVALEGELWEIIERRGNERSYQKPDGTVGMSLYVFHRKGQPIGDFRKVWDSAHKVAGLEKKLFHDFRRTAARNMRRAGVPEKVCMDLLGHRTTSMFHRYSICDEQDICEAVIKTQQYLKTVSSVRAVVPVKKASGENS